MRSDAAMQDRLLGRLREIYGDRGDEVLPGLLEVLECYPNLGGSRREELWDQRDAILITYGDQVAEAGHTHLAALRRFLTDYQLPELINTTHILPFCPSTSDDGFSVVDYTRVDPQLGDWDDIERLAAESDLMFDLVLNHVSQASPWFQGYLSGDPRYRDYFIEISPETDLSAVTRPRSSPLLTQFETNRGPRYVWTTFSSDQIDLNYAHPPVLLDVLNSLLLYIRRGARYIRLDAIAYLWKEVGTNCIHLPQTHAIVKLMRDVVEICAPHVILLTETNVPHVENISYFGNGDEAHMVYQFSLPPLLADALLQENATTLTNWLSTLDATPPATTYFNFTASHDGVGVRPLEGLVSSERHEQLVAAARARGGRISNKRNEDGSESAYELNVTYFDLLSDPENPGSELHVARFLASQAIAMSLRGIPGIYFHSLVGTPNDVEAVEETGIARRINRRRYRRETLDAMLADKNSTHRLVFDAYRHLLRLRTAQRAFHPDGHQHVYRLPNRAVLAFLRVAPGGDQHIVVLANLSSTSQTVDLSFAADIQPAHDLLRDRAATSPFVLAPFQVAWLAAKEFGE